MAKKKEPPKTKDEQMKFIHEYAAYFTERIWEVLDEYKVSYNIIQAKSEN